MPRKQPKLFYPVVTFTVVGIALFGFLTKATVHTIPPHEPNRLATERGRYLQAGSRQLVDWYAFGPEPFRLAAEQGKPILLVLGASWSASARRADRDVFTDTDVLALLAQYCVSIRADLVERPDLATAFIPIQRARWINRQGFQVYVLDAQGRLVESLFDESGRAITSPSVFFQRLLGALDRVQRLRSPDPLDMPAGASQRTEWDLLTASRAGHAPDFALFDALLRERGSSKFGGFPNAGVQTLHPHLYRYLLLTGQHEMAAALLDPILRSNLVDWLDGGFFRLALLGPPHTIEYDKIAAENAEMMHVLALAHATSGKQEYRLVAERTFDSLTTRFLALEGLPAVARLGDESSTGRSARSSFSPAELRNLAPDVRRWVVDVFDLDPWRNRAMTIRIRDLQAVLKDRAGFQNALEVLARLQAAEPPYEGAAKLDAAGTCVARLYETAALLGDRRRLEVVHRLWLRIQGFRAGQDVLRSLEGQMNVNAYLGDYLAFADAALQRALVSGDAEAFEVGAHVLDRATFLFGHETPGAWLTAYREPDPPAPPFLRMPNVSDTPQEALTSKLMRLCWAYGRLALAPEGKGKLSPLAARLLQAASSTWLQNGPIAHNLELGGGSFHCAALEMTDEAFAVTVGPDAVDRAARLRRLAPGRLVAAASPVVRPDLRARAPGIYVVVGPNVFGPYDEARAVAALSGQR